MGELKLGKILSMAWILSILQQKFLFTREIAKQGGQIEIPANRYTREKVLASAKLRHYEYFMDELNAILKVILQDIRADNDNPSVIDYSICNYKLLSQIHSFSDRQSLISVSETKPEDTTIVHKNRKTLSFDKNKTTLYETNLQCDLIQKS